MSHSITSLAICVIHLGIYLYLFYTFGFLISMCLIFISYTSIDLFLSYVFSIHLIRGTDLVFYYSDPRNNCNITCGFVVKDKLDPEKVKSSIAKKLYVTYPEFRTSRYDAFGIMHFWKQWDTSLPNIEKAMKQVKVVKEEIKDKSQIASLVEKISMVEIKSDGLQWEVYIADYANNNTLLIMKGHHGLIDGMGALLLMAGIDGGLSKETIPQMKDVGLIAKVGLLAISPFYAVYSLFKDFKTKNDNSPFKLEKGGYTGVKNLTVSKQYQFGDLRNAYKKYDNATFNDFFMGCVGVAMKQVCTLRGFDQCDSIGVGLPISLRPSPKVLSDLKIQNLLGFFIVGFPIGDNFKQNLEKGRVALRERFDLKAIWGSQSILLFIKYLPECIGRILPALIGKFSTVILSNVPGPKTEITILGHQVSDMIALTPHLGMMGISVLGYTYNGTFEFSVYQDTGVKVDSKLFGRLIEQEIDNAMK